MCDENEMHAMREPITHCLGDGFCVSNPAVVVELNVKDQIFFTYEYRMY